LTYNLIQDDHSYKISASHVDRELRIILASLNEANAKGSENVDKMIYLLDYKYTDASLRLDALKGCDLEKAQRLFSVCGEYGFTLYLASMERKVCGTADDDDHNGIHMIDEIIEETLKLTRVVDTDGVVVDTDLHIVEDDILQSDSFEREPNEHDYQGHTGNEGE
jgi:hypothetical protein